MKTLNNLFFLATVIFVETRSAKGVICLDLADSRGDPDFPHLLSVLRKKRHKATASNAADILRLSHASVQGRVYYETEHVKVKVLPITGS